MGSRDVYTQRPLCDRQWPVMGREPADGGRPRRKLTRVAAPSARSGNRLPKRPTSRLRQAVSSSRSARGRLAPQVGCSRSPEVTRGRWAEIVHSRSCGEIATRALCPLDPRQRAKDHSAKGYRSWARRKPRNLCRLAAIVAFRNAERRAPGVLLKLPPRYTLLRQSPPTAPSQALPSPGALV